MVLGKEGEEEGCGAGGEIVECVEGQWAQDQGEEEGWEEGRRWVEGEEEGLFVRWVSG